MNTPQSPPPPAPPPPVTPITDGHTAIRAPQPGDAAILIAGRDPAFKRFLGEGSPDPRPSACILARNRIIGWVDYDPEPDWLEPGEVNVGYNVFAAHRGRGHASRAVMLLMHHLALHGVHRAAVLLIRRDNDDSLALARRLGFDETGTRDDSIGFKRSVPPLSYTDGTVTIRRRETSDLDEDLAAKDAEQQRWLWMPEDREAWRTMDPREQRAHALRVLEDNHRTFGQGPKWTFSVDATDATNVACVDCDLANDSLRGEGVPFGEANISYASHPAHRGRGYVSRAVHLVIRFLAGHTAARTAHFVIETENEASLRVARSLEARLRSRFINEEGNRMCHFEVPIERTTTL